MKNVYSLIPFFIFVLESYAKTYVVATVGHFNQVKNKLVPGDTVVFKNDVWHDAEISITNKGTKSKPIVLIAETPGKVSFTGNSRIKIGGEWIEVNGFYFKDGYAANGAIIEFRESPSQLGSYCRVTNCVIDNFNRPDRLQEDNWVVLYGRSNRFDHNYVADKKNLGTTLCVELNDVRNQENGHRIDHNFFGRRLRLGSNGGETIRIGTSTFSKTSSRTIVEENYFYHCNGEVEIISVKSSDNILRRNTFFECEGGLVLRHGDRNLVEENFFIGNNKELTGGVRVINAGHTIQNNLFYQLAGERFRSALAILNGVPNSPINRYDQVKNVTISNNVFIDCGNIELCAGKDFERTAVPQNVSFSNNLFISHSVKTKFTVNDDISGISFRQNKTNHRFEGIDSAGFLMTALKNHNDKDGWEIEGKPYKLFATSKNCGASWFDNHKSTIATKMCNAVVVPIGENTLYEKALAANEGDTLLLESGKYLLSKTILIAKRLYISGLSNQSKKPIIQFTGEHGGFSFFSIENGGSLYLSGVRLNGLSDNSVAESFIRTSQKPMLDHYNLFVDQCDFENITDGRKNALKVNKASFADTIRFSNCHFTDISGEVISIAAEKDDKGIYNAEHVIIVNCVFNKVLVGAIDVYRGGNDESTTGPYFIMDHCTFNDVGNVELCSVVRLLGVQYSSVTNCIFNNSGRSGRTVKYEDYGWTKNIFSHCNSFVAGRTESFYNNIIRQPIWNVNPEFENIPAGDFRLKSTSPLKRKGSDGEDPGAVWVNGKLDLKY